MHRLYLDTHTPLPPLRSPLLLDSVQTLSKKALVIKCYVITISAYILFSFPCMIVSAKKIRNGEVTSEQLVNLFVERIK